LFFKYIISFLLIIIKYNPNYVLYPLSFERKPFFKDIVFVFIGRLFGCKIIQFDFGQYLPELFKTSNYLIQKLILSLLKRIDAFIVMGKNTKKLYQEFFPVERIFVVPGSVKDTYKNFGNIRKESCDIITVLYFSLLCTSKGLWTALNSIEGVIKNNPAVRYIFAGQTDSQDTLNQYNKVISEKKLEKFVFYKGYIADEIQRLKCFRNSDIFIFPTQRDVFGLVLLHAMAESLPVIATTEGNIPEIVEDGVNGYLIDKDNSEQLTEKILQLAYDSNLRESIGKANRIKYLEKYTPSKYSKNMIDTFDTMINLME
jgi:glycosyltransferase involved in cell wall biosynthesis